MADLIGSRLRYYFWQMLGTQMLFVADVIIIIIIIITIPFKFQ